MDCLALPKAIALLLSLSISGTVLVPAMAEGDLSGGLEMGSDGADATADANGNVNAPDMPDATDVDVDLLAQVQSMFDDCLGGLADALGLGGTAGAEDLPVDLDATLEDVNLDATLDEANLDAEDLNVRTVTEGSVGDALDGRLGVQVTDEAAHINPHLVATGQDDERVGVFGGTDIYYDDLTAPRVETHPTYNVDGVVDEHIGGANHAIVDGAGIDTDAELVDLRDDNDLGPLGQMNGDTSVVGPLTP